LLEKDFVEVNVEIVVVWCDCVQVAWVVVVVRYEDREGVVVVT